MITGLLVVTIFPLAMAFAAATDLLSMTVPNWISGLLIAGFIVLAPLVGLGWSEAGLHAGAAVCALIAALVPFSMRWIGGGDAKLFAAICLWMGPAQLLPFAMHAAFLGGALTLLILLVRSAPLPAVLSSHGWIARLHDAKEGVPYGVALAGAALLVYSDTAFMAGLAI